MFVPLQPVQAGSKTNGRPFPSHAGIVTAIPHQVRVIDFEDGGIDQNFSLPILTQLQCRPSRHVPVFAVGARRMANEPWSPANKEKETTNVTRAVSDMQGEFFVDLRSVVFCIAPSLLTRSLQYVNSPTSQSLDRANRFWNNADHSECK